MADNQLPTVDIRGNPYVMVKDRILAFNEKYPNGSIATEITVDGPFIRATASVWPDVATPSRRFMGHAESDRSGSGIMAQAPLEVAETSAVGRALAFMGIGVIESIASADEVVKAQSSVMAPASSRTSVQMPRRNPTRTAPSEASSRITEAQARLINKLTKEANIPTPDLRTMSKVEASRIIENLLSPRVAEPTISMDEATSIANEIFPDEAN